MHYREVMSAIDMVYKHGKKQVKTVLVIGKPGIGKTEMAYALQEKFLAETGVKYTVIKRRVADLFAEDFSGIPDIDKVKGVTTFYPPDFMPMKGNPEFDHPDKFFILLLDEVNRGKPDVQQAMMKVLDRDGFVDNCLVICTGNLGFEDNTNVEEFDSAQQRRFLTLRLDANPDDWLTWAREKEVDSSICTFISAHPEFLHYEIETKTGQKSFITPAHWAELDKIFKLNPDQPKTTIVKAIGIQHLAAVSTHFLKFLHNEVAIGIRDLYNLSKDLKKKLLTLSRDRIHQLNASVVEHIVKLPELAKDDKMMVYNYITLKRPDGSALLTDDNYASIIKTFNEKKKEVVAFLMDNYPEEKDHITRVYLGATT